MMISVIPLVWDRADRHHGTDPSGSEIPGSGPGSPHFSDEIA